MAYRLSSQAFDKWLESLWENGEVYGPSRFKNKGAFSDTDLYSYGPIHKLEDLERDQKTYLSPKEMAFPTRETLFYFGPDSVTVPKLAETPIYVFLRPCDINGFDRLDTIFLKNGPFVDPYYENRRNRLRFFLLDCGENGFDSCFCVSMGTNTTNKWHAAFDFSTEGVTVGLNDKETSGILEGKDIASSLKAGLEMLGEAVSFDEPNFVTVNQTQVEVPPVESLNPSLFEHPVWQEYTARCIACGRCNTSCPTCSCFTMQDVKHGEEMGERRRRWASCHVKGYSDMAGGHTFRSKNGEKMRFKTMHKINDYHKRFDKHMCVGCGRCDDVCPEYISFSKCINKLSAIVKEQEGAKHDSNE